MKKLSSVFLNAILLFFCLLAVFPFIWMLCSSFKTNAEISSLAQTLFPQHFSFQNYSDVLNKFDFFRYFGNSLIYALLITVITVYTSTIAGYVLCKYRFKGRDALFTMVLMTMMIPGKVQYCLSYLASLAVMSPSTKSRSISVLALLRNVMDFLKCPGYLPVPL